MVRARSTVLVTAVVFHLLVGCDGMPPEEKARSALDDAQQMKALLDSGLDPNMRFSSPNDAGFHLLHSAAVAGYLDTCRLLVSRGADVDARTDAGQTPLMMTVLSRYLDQEVPDAQYLMIFRYLISEGADVNAVDNYGKSLADYLREYASDNPQFWHIATKNGMAVP